MNTDCKRREHKQLAHLLPIVCVYCSSNVFIRDAYSICIIKVCVTQTLIEMVNSEKFITVEGIEGVGKTSCIDFIKQYLLAKDCVVETTREPGGTLIAEKIRKVLLACASEQCSASTELMLLTAARNQHINHFIKPHLAQGHWVISDRYIDSTYAYQAGGRGISMRLLDKCQELLDHCVMPTITFLLDASIKVSQLRMSIRNQAKDRFEQEDVDFFERVRSKYLDLAHLYPQRIKVIDAAHSLKDVKAQIVNHLQQL